MYHYTDSGLDNIFLVNGYREDVTPYGRAVAIEDIEGLHAVIGQWIINQPKSLCGAELRFLRHELDLSQKKLGALIGKSEQAIGRWERAEDKPIDPVADRLIRVIYAEWNDDTKPIKALIEKLAELDHQVASQCRLEERNGRWRASTTLPACA